MMRVGHVLRKYNPAEWGGTETALQRLFASLRPHGVEPVVYFPRYEAKRQERDPFAEAGYALRPFRAQVPVAGMPAEQKRQWLAVGGNLMSFDLPAKLWREKLEVVHAHCLGRLGALAGAVAKARRLPLVITIHGGVLDLPPSLKQRLTEATSCGWEWGKIFGFLLRARGLLARADAILTCNPREAELLKAQYPRQRIQVQPHGVSTALFRERDCRSVAYEAYPQVVGREVLLVVSRIDPVKNQGWLLEELPVITRAHPKALLVLAGACTDMGYGSQILQRIHKLGIQNQVMMTGGLSPGDPRLVGLFQAASAVVLPSISETFGLVILEAWAAGAAPIASGTSGAKTLIQHRGNGWLFDLAQPRTYHEAVNEALRDRNMAERLAEAGLRLVRSEYDTDVLAGRMATLYRQLREEKNALRHSA